MIDEAFNQKLNELILKAGQHPFPSHERSVLVNQAISKIEKSGELPNFKNTEKEEVLQITFMWLYKNAHKYDPHAYQHSSGRGDALPWFRQHLWYRNKDFDIETIKEFSTKIPLEHSDRDQEESHIVVGKVTDTTWFYNI